MEKIEKIPYYRLSQFPNVLSSDWAPEFRPQDNYSFVSPISNEYLLKIDSLRKKYNFKLLLIPSLVPISKKKDIGYLLNQHIEEVNFSLRNLLRDYIKNVTYVQDSCFIDGTHLKSPFLHKHYFKRKMDSLLLQKEIEYSSNSR